MKRACKRCRKLTEDEKCPICGSKELITNWRGRIYVFDPKLSEVAKITEIGTEGEFAIKVQ